LGTTLKPHREFLYKKPLLNLPLQKIFVSTLLQVLLRLGERGKLAVLFLNLGEHEYLLELCIVYTTSDRQVTVVGLSNQFRENKIFCLQQTRTPKQRSTSNDHVGLHWRSRLAAEFRA